MFRIPCFNTVYALTAFCGTEPPSVPHPMALGFYWPRAILTREAGRAGDLY